MAWIDLLVAGVFEVVWSTCLKYSHGFTNVKFTLLTFAGMVFARVYQCKVYAANLCRYGGKLLVFGARC